MSALGNGGKGKGGKGGKGSKQGIGKSSQRHRRNKSNGIQGISKPAIRRLARRAGVKRISGTIYLESRVVIKAFLTNVIKDAVTYCEYSKRKTITALDVVYALKRQGRSIYGFGP